jgi:membrane associated rhomboid family serine protease
MSSGGPDLFVVCKSCRSEVSPYITECPYCGARLRKRAPKLDRGGRPSEPKRRRPSRPSLGRLRPGEIPGIRADSISRPYVTIAAVVASLVVLVLWRAGLFDIADAVVFGKLGDEWWRIFTAPFVHSNTGYAFVALCGLGLFGMLIERRHGHAVALGLLLLAGAGGMLVSAVVQTMPLALGANGAALGLLAAWAIPPLRELRTGEEPEADLIGAAVFAAVLLLLPAVVPEADWIAGIAGGLIGFLAGLPLARFARA